jgi:hypothetical protein
MFAVILKILDEKTLVKYLKKGGNPCHRRESNSQFEKKDLRQIVNSFTNIKRKNNNFSPQITEHKKTMTFVDGSPGLRHVQ